MQRKKNIRLLILLVILMTVTVVLYSVKEGTEGTEVNSEKFSVEDTASIQRIVISGPQITNELARTSGNWLVNDKYLLDEGMKAVLLSVLHKVRIQRPVAEIVRQEVMDSLKQQGYRVQIYDENNLLMEYLAGGDKEANQSYFLKSGEQVPYIVHLPGYESYVSGLFEIKENDWRNRILLATNWNVIDSVQMLYLDSPESSFTIRFQNNRYAIVSMPDTDTLALYNYMDQISYLLADQFIDRSEYPRYDSLSGTTPLAILSVQEIGSPQANQVVFFRPLPKEAVLLGMSGQQLVLFDQRRISQVLRRRDSFLAE